MSQVGEREGFLQVLTSASPFPTGPERADLLSEEPLSLPPPPADIHAHTLATHKDKRARGHTHRRPPEPSPSVYSTLGSCSQEEPLLLKKGKLVKVFG